MKTAQFLALSAVLAALAAPAAAAEEAPSKLEAVPAPPPIPAGITEDDFEPEVTIIKKGEDTVEEYRHNGKLYMVKVTPPHGVPYYLVDRKGDGVFERETADPKLSVPMWVIKRW